MSSRTALLAETISARDLNARVREAWLDIITESESLKSPYFHPSFTEIIAAERTDARVGVLSAGRRIVGLLPFHIKRSGVAAPIGGPVSDFQGLIAREPDGVDMRGAIRGWGLSAFDFNHAVAGQRAFSEAAHLTTRSPSIDLSAGYEAWHADRRGASDVKTAQRKAQKLARDHGPLRLSLHDDTEEAWTAFVAWKTAALKALNARPFDEIPWLNRAMNAFRRHREPGFAAPVTALYAGDTLAAVHFGLRTDAVWHWWFPTYNPELAAYSPGMVMLLELAREAARAGVTAIDLGRGEARYKTAFANSATPICEGSIAAGARPSALTRKLRGALQRSPQRRLPERYADLTRRAGNRLLGACALRS